MRCFNATSCFLVRNFAKMEKFKDLLSSVLSHWPFFTWKIITPLHLHSFSSCGDPLHDTDLLFSTDLWIKAQSLLLFIKSNTIAKAGSCNPFCFSDTFYCISQFYVYTMQEIWETRKTKRIWTKIISE